MPFKFIILFVALITGNAYGFIPELKYIYEDLTANNKNIKTYHIKQKRTIYPSSGSEKGVELSENVFLQNPWKFARISAAGEKSWMTVYDGSQGLEIAQGRWFVPQDKFKLPILYGFYFSCEPEELTSFLSLLGITSAKTTYERIRGTFAIALYSGDNPGGPRFLLDRKSFKPIAYLNEYEGDRSGPRKGLEYVFSNYRSVAPGVFYPLIVKVFSNGNLVEKTEAQPVEVNGKVLSNVFDVKYLKEKYPKLSGRFPQENEFFLGE